MKGKLHWEELGIETLRGKTFSSVKRGEFNGYESVIFIGEQSYVLHHWQECCERVWIEDICGDLSDLENSEILQAEHTEVEGKFDTTMDDVYFDDLCESHWYKLATIKGYVTIRFNGTSNGYYSVDATLSEIQEVNDAD